MTSQVKTEHYSGKVTPEEIKRAYLHIYPERESMVLNGFVAPEEMAKNTLVKIMLPEGKVKGLGEF